MSHRHKWGSQKGTLFFKIASIVLVLVTSAYSDSEIEGHWEGAFGRLGSIQSVQIDFVHTDTGYSATYSIPDLILYREPVRELSVTPDSISFRLFWGRFACRHSATVDEITGENNKWNPAVSIHLKRTLNENDFRIEPVSFQSGSVTLHGDLLLPTGNRPFPAVIVIEGSTTEGRKLWTYRSIGDLLARNGIAALVYDKRGVGQSDGDLESASFDDLASDVVAAAKLLSERSDIDQKHIGLFGISQGGWLAPLAASESDKASFVINLAGPAVSIWKQEIDRVEYSMKAGILGEDEPDQFTAEQIDSAVAHTRLGFDVVTDPTKWDEWLVSVRAAQVSPWASYVMLDSIQSEMQYWARFNYDPKEALSHTTLPLLALLSENDVLVPPATNLPLYKKYLVAAGNNNAEIVVFDGVGHDFFTGATLVGNEWSWPSGFWRWNRRAPGLADTIITWIERQID